MIDWIEIPAGRVILGKGYDKTAHSVGQSFDLPAFQISKYPVTNEQYEAFINARGYQTRRWWTDTGWDARLTGWVWMPNDREHMPSDQPWEMPLGWRERADADYPVVGVSWYEAVAFCRFMSETNNTQIALPTEQQWQRAAQGDDGRVYPWGNDWDCTRCNNSVKPCKGNGTSPVTQYARSNASPFGVVDMAGNVVEWTLTVYRTGSQVMEGNDARLLRGGSWHSFHAEWLACGFRHGVVPLLRDDICGFRVVRMA